MKVPWARIAHYFSVLLSKIEDYNEPVYYVTPSGELLLKLSELDESIKRVEREANYRNEKEPLRLAMEYLLLHPGVKIMEYTNGHYDHHEGALHQAVAYLHEKLWPEIPIPEKSPDIEIVAMDLDEWWSARNKLREEEEAKKQSKVEKT